MTVLRTSTTEVGAAPVLAQQSERHRRYAGGVTGSVPRRSLKRWQRIIFANDLHHVAGRMRRPIA